MRKTKKSDDLKAMVILGIVLAIVALWLIVSAMVWTYFGSLDDGAKYGSLAQAVGALFSGLALAGISVAIFLQRTELELQREELRSTRTELARAAIAQEKSEEALAKQAAALETTARMNALAFVPVLTVELQLAWPHTILRVHNPSNYFAFDVNVLIVGIYHTDSIPIDEFVQRYVSLGENELAKELSRPAFEHAQSLKPDSEGFFATFDQISRRFFPDRRLLVEELLFPRGPEAAYALLQYRDMQGENFHHVFGFGRSFGEADEDRFYSSLVRPPVPTRSPRIAFELPGSHRKRKEGYKLRTEDDSSLPDYLQEHISSYLSDAIAPGLIRHGIDFEERGRFAN